MFAITGSALVAPDTSRCPPPARRWLTQSHGSLVPVWAEESEHLVHRPLLQDVVHVATDVPA
jgi:hypothetical protein